MFSFHDTSIYNIWYKFIEHLISFSPSIIIYNLKTYSLSPISKCNLDCHCNYMKYNPVCSQDGRTTYISACQAGCRHVSRINGSNVFTDCTCIRKDETVASEPMIKMKKTSQVEKGSEDERKSESGFAIPGRCQVDCLTQFYTFLIVVCLLKFVGATGRTSNFLVTVR